MNDVDADDLKGDYIYDVGKHDYGDNSAGLFDIDHKLETFQQLDYSEMSDERITAVDLTSEDDLIDNSFAVPLTFDTSADLLWKLKKASVIQTNSQMPSQR